MNKLKQHSDAKLFPCIGEVDFRELKDDIKSRGLLNPVVMYEGKILDGWSRYKACIELKIEPKFTTFTNTTITALDYVISQNLMRRHLTTPQKAAIAIEYKRLISKQIGGRGWRSNRSPGSPTGRASDIAGKMLGVSGDTVDRMESIQKRDLKAFKLVKDGKLPFKPTYNKVMGRFDRIARSVLNESDFTGYIPPESVHCSDYEIDQFDRYLKTKGLSLCVTRIEDSWDAVYTKSESKPTSGFTTRKAAILSAGNKALQSMKEVV